MSRPLIRYDLDDGPPEHQHTNGRRPPAKKRTRNPKSSTSLPRARFQHWDDPGNAAVGMVYDEQEVGDATLPPAACSGSATTVNAGHVEERMEDKYDLEEGTWDEAANMEAEYGEEGNEDEEEEESRPLTHDEIWDDSALIDAWNSAQAEYEAYHGTSASWKSEPVKKSPLWYNTPYTGPLPQAGPSDPKSPAKRAKLSHSRDQEEGELDPDMAPLDFHSYVPTHDPSLGMSSDTHHATSVSPFAPPLSTIMVSRDEAFNNALNSMYWSGYWTAVYHCQSQAGGKSSKVQTEGSKDIGLEEDADEEDLVPAQR